jgi:hypothetical protein
MGRPRKYTDDASRDKAAKEAKRRYELKKKWTPFKRYDSDLAI